MGVRDTAPPPQAHNCCRSKFRLCPAVFNSVACNLLLLTRQQTNKCIRLCNMPESIGVHSYIHNWQLQTFSQDYGIASHTTNFMRVLILYVSGGTNSLTSTPNDRFLRNFFMAYFIYSQSFCQKADERKSPKK